MDVYACNTGVAACEKTTSKKINIPVSFKIDLKRKHFTGIRTGGVKAETPIDKIQHLDKKIILLGAHKGRKGVRVGFGWSLAIMEEHRADAPDRLGAMVGVVVFGSCISGDP